MTEALTESGELPLHMRRNGFDPAEELGRVRDDDTLSIPGSLTRFAETHPADDAEVVTGLTKVIESLLDQAGADAA